MKRARGMLFNQTDFWLVEVQGPAVTQRIKAKWTDSGSMRLIQEFFPQGPWHGISDLCKHLKVKIADPFYFKSVTTAFLGAGGIGRVFRVVPDSMELKDARLHNIMALKVVFIHDAESLKLECARLNYHHEKCKECPLLAKPMCSEVITISEKLAGFILSPVGLPISYKKLWEHKCKWFIKVIEALKQLHIHGIAHGDPRLPNVIISADKLIWIDIVGAYFSPENEVERNILFQRDMRILLQSLLHIAPLPPDLDVAVSNYNPNDYETIEKIIRICTTSLSK